MAKKVTLFQKGGFGGNKDHDPHLLFTLSAIQVLVLLDAVDQLPDRKKTIECIFFKNY
jgi:geranylgeranyl transferase type-2 subunit beta